MTDSQSEPTLSGPRDRLGRAAALLLGVGLFTMFASWSSLEHPAAWTANAIGCLACVIAVGLAVAGHIVARRNGWRAPFSIAVWVTVVVIAGAIGVLFAVVDLMIGGNPIMSGLISLLANR